MEIQNVKITKVGLEMGDYGNLIFKITIEGAGIRAIIRSYPIARGYLGAEEFVAENGDGLVAMMRIMDVVGVERWEDLEGNYCRVKHDGLGSIVSVIGNIIDDKWFDVKAFF